jgi:hypothetical protein
MASLNLKGKWYSTLYGPTGEIKQAVNGYNTITTGGISALVQHLVSATAAATTFTHRYIAIGSDNTAEASDDTALGTELARHTGTVSQVTDGIYRVTATFPSGTGTGNVYEYGLFDSNTAGTMFSRDTEALVTKSANDDLVVVTEITYS